ncbi:DUF397 domain-containing protein [Actinoplanes friuliensis]|uniref:DUF397 domain-containing protein n=1 Tax=Actinoplanes friuliensis TaxID=196914 RepID=UPI0034DAED27
MPPRASVRSKTFGRELLTLMVKWSKSSYCSDSACVEVAVVDVNEVGLRNSTLPGRRLQFDMINWRDFIAAVKAGEFQNL